MRNEKVGIPENTDPHFLIFYFSVFYFSFRISHSLRIQQYNTPFPASSYLLFSGTKPAGSIGGYSA